MPEGQPSVVREAARKFGSSTIVVSIEAIKRSAGRYEAYTDNGRERTGIDAFEWAVRAEDVVWRRTTLSLRGLAQEATPLVEELLDPDAALRVRPQV